LIGESARTEEDTKEFSLEKCILIDFKGKHSEMKT